MASYKRLLKVKKRAEKWKKRYQQCQKDNDTLYAEYKQKEARIKDLEQAYQGAYAEVKRLKQLIIEKDKSLGIPLMHKQGFEDLLSDYEGLEQENTRLEKELEEKLQEIGEMGTTIASQTDSLLKAQNRNARLEQVILGLKKSVKVRDEQLKAVMPVDPESANKKIQELETALIHCNGLLDMAGRVKKETRARYVSGSGGTSSG